MVFACAVWGNLSFSLSIGLACCEPCHNEHPQVGEENG